MKISVLFFATLKDKIGTGGLSFEFGHPVTVGEFKSLLVNSYPALEQHLKSVIVSVNREFAFDPEIIPDGAEVALFPPVSGGSEPLTICKVTYDAVSSDELVNQVTFASTGAVCVFVGVVRGETTRGKAHTTALLEYEAYIPMAEAKMKQLADEIRQQWPLIEGIAIVQRIGKLDPGTPTVWIACAAAHRDTGVFDAARYGIDRLKEIVPIWKKEVGADGETWVEGNYLPVEGD